MIQKHTPVNKESAVSEVVGVILMLSITVIVAGIVIVVASSHAPMPNTGITADIKAVSAGNNTLSLEQISGSSFSVNDVEVRLGIREDKTVSVLIRNDGTEKSIISSSGTEIVEPGDLLRIKGNKIAGESGTEWSGMKVKSGQHLTYAIYDKTGNPVSAGEIRMP